MQGHLEGNPQTRRENCGTHAQNGLLRVNKHVVKCKFPDIPLPAQEDILGVQRNGEVSPMRERKVFLSSTFKDLANYREIVYRAIQRMDGWRCIRMEDFGARDWESDEFCQQKVAECDLFVGILGLLYGSVHEPSQLSYTEREYQAALNASKPHLMFLTPDDFPVPGNLIESDDKRQKQQTFRRRVSTDRVRDANWTSPDQLATSVVTAIRNWERELLEKSAPPETQKVSEEELNLLYEAAKRLENAGQVFAAAANYWRIWRTRPEFRDVESKLASLEKLYVETFVGRQHELDTLTRLLDHSLRGTGSIAFVSGEAGTGKTWLVRAFLRQAQNKYGNLVYSVGSCNALSGIGEPYLPFRQAFSLLCGEIEDQLVLENISMTNARRLSQVALGVAQAILDLAPSLLGTLVPLSLKPIGLGVDRVTSKVWDRVVRPPSGFDSAVSAFAHSARTTIFLESARVLRRIAQDFPLILFFDDLQWSDSASVDLLYHLGLVLHGTPTMLIGAFRPSEIIATKHPLANCMSELKVRRLEFGEIDLDKADDNFVSEFIACKYTPNQFISEFVTRMQAHTGGNALFISELFQYFEETKRIILDERGVWRIHSTFEFHELPPKVEAVIEKRIANLEADLRKLLEVASVEGEEFTTEVVAHLRRIEERQLLERLSMELERKMHLVALSRSVAVQQKQLYMYRFRHALIRMYLYGSLSPVERELLHRDIGLCLESIYGAATGQISSVLAEHFDKANMPEKEAPYRLMAALVAVQSGAWTTGVYHLDRLESILNDPTSSLSRQTRIELAKELYNLRGNLYALILMPENALNDFERLEVMARADGDTCALARALYGRGILARAQNDLKSALEFVSQVYTLVPEGQCVDVIADCKLLEAKANRDRAQYEETLQCAEMARVLYEKLNKVGSVLDALSQIAYAYYGKGQYDEAERIWTANLSTYNKYAMIPGDPDDDANFCLGFLNWRLKRYQKAKVFFSVALETAQQTNNLRKRAYCLNDLALVETDLGSHDEAETLLREVISICESQGLDDKKLFTWALGNLGANLTRAGKLEEAWKFLGRNRALALERDNKSDVAESSRRISEFYLQRSMLPEAYQWAQQALREAQEIGRRAFVGMTYRVLGEIALTARRAPEVNLPDVQDPEVYFEQSVQIARETGNLAEEVQSLHAWGEYLVQLPDVYSRDKGKSLIQDADKLQSRMLEQA